MDSNKAVQLYNEAIDAVDHQDAAVASRLLKEWDFFVSALPQEYVNDAEVQRDLPVLKKDLWCTAFPELPLADAQKIFSAEILYCLNRGIDLGNLISLRYTFASYGSQEKERQTLKEAILKNTELIGRISIGEWLGAFDRVLNPDTREENGVNDFMTRESRVASLGKDEQGVLRIILDVYDRYLATEVVSIFDLAVTVRGASTPSGGSIQSQGTGRFGGQPSTVRLPLLQALSKYEQLGNQLITEERIKLKSQAETVRPSLLYWIKYYRDELGVGHHSSVDRGNFLFRSENGKRLSSEERERVNLVLKSVEENYPVEVDIEQGVIIFPPFVAPPSTPRAPQMPPQPPMAPQRTSFQPSGSAVFQPTPPAQSISQPGGMSFSTKHVLPAEKDQSEAPRQAMPPRPMAPGTMSVRSNPFHIRPVSMGEKEEE